MVHGRLSGVAQDPLVGQVLSGRYRILAKLGEGAMASVYLAEHSGVGATIVLKVLLPELANDAEVVESFLREARIAAEIHHDNVIDIYYSGRSPEGHVFLAMEYVKGATLFDVLEKDGPLPWARARPLLEQIAGALAAAHSQGVVHRDVKPENVLVGSRPATDGQGGPVEYVKVVDFGIANARGDIGGAEGVCGTPEFMPPEQAQGRPPDARDDVYAFGCLMYQVLTGDVPFRDDDIARVLLMHLRDPVQPPRQRRPDLFIPAAAQSVVMRALQKKREDRWQDMAEVVRAIENIGDDPEPEPVPEPEPAAPRALTPRVAPAPAEAPPRLVMPKGHLHGRLRVPLIVGSVAVVAVCAFALVRHALLHAPGRIEIVTDPADAEVFIDGQKMADQSPLFLDASPGSYAVVVTHAGFATLSRVLEMRPRAADRVLLTLAPVAVAKPFATGRHASSGASSGGGAGARRRVTAPAINGVTFIDFKKSAAAQNGH